jgi:hypothetical protein
MRSPLALVGGVAEPGSAVAPVKYPDNLAAPAARAGRHRVYLPGHLAPRDPSARLADEFRHGRHVERSTRFSSETVVVQALRVLSGQGYAVAEPSSPWGTPTTPEGQARAALALNDAWATLAAAENNPHGYRDGGVRGRHSRLSRLTPFPCGTKCGTNRVPHSGSERLRAVRGLACRAESGSRLGGGGRRCSSDTRRRTPNGGSDHRARRALQRL